jgi:hypothetical protein
VRLSFFGKHFLSIVAHFPHRLLPFITLSVLYDIAIITMLMMRLTYQKVVASS